MPTHSERRFLPYAPDRLYELVAEVEDYPAFLPWCAALRVSDRSDKALRAEMIVRFGALRESFTSEVSLTPKSRIDVRYLDGPFRRLENRWLFLPADGGCDIDFFIDFEFRSLLLRKLMEPLFHKAVRRMVRAFETRARERYG